MWACTAAGASKEWLGLGEQPEKPELCSAYWQKVALSIRKRTLASLGSVASRAKWLQVKSFTKPAYRPVPLVI